MEKLRLKSLHSKGEVLSRAQLKKVLGGTGSMRSASCYCIIKPSTGNQYTVPDYYCDGHAGNEACLGYIALHQGSCHYDCNYDGLGS